MSETHDSPPPQDTDDTADVATSTEIIEIIEGASEGAETPALTDAGIEVVDAVEVVEVVEVVDAVEVVEVVENEPESVLDLAAIARDLDGVEHALTRLDDGTYWIDEVTGAPLPDDLLATNPVARRV